MTVKFKRNFYITVPKNTWIRKFDDFLYGINLPVIKYLVIAIQVILMIFFNRFIEKSILIFEKDKEYRYNNTSKNVLNWEVIEVFGNDIITLNPKIKKYQLKDHSIEMYRKRNSYLLPDILFEYYIYSNIELRKLKLSKLQK